MRRNLLMTFLLLALPLSGCAITYSADPITARVVDAETKAPIEGVIVVAHWQLKGGMEGGNNVGQMNVLETVTNQNGQFYFPGWGPKLRSLSGELKTESPEILLFTNGYRYLRLLNVLDEKSLRGELDMPLKSYWDKKTIEMEKFKGSLEEYAEHVRDLNNNLEFSTDEPEKCHWKKIPRTILAMRQQRKYFEEQGVNPHTLSLIDQELIMNDEYYTNKGGSRCGSPKDFIRSLQQ